MMVTKALAESWVGIIGQYGEMASVLAADLFEVEAVAMGLRPRTVTVPAVDPERAIARLGWAVSEQNQMGNALGLLDELVKQPYRSTYQKSAWQSGAGWARVPSGREPCRWCLMLASRGGVYNSKQLASLGTDGRKYHGDCHCVPTLVRGPRDYPAGYDPDALYEQYQAARSAAETTDAQGIAAAWRNLSGVAH